jgi:hypothetical protein
MTHLRIAASGMLAALLAGGAAAAQLRPRDDAPKDPSFLTFRRKLLEAVRKRDRAFVRKILDHKIRVSFGEGGGKEEFARQWKLASGTSPLWKTLFEVLSLGGTFSGQGKDRLFAAPYTYSAFPESLDAFQHFCVIAPNVPLRAKPGEQERVVARLNYDIVRQVAPPRSTKPTSSGWVYVATAAGKRGYIARRYVRSPIDYRALFARRNGEWRMTALVAGD